MWNDLSFDTFPIFPYRNIPQITAQCGGADSSHCLLKVQAASAGIPVAEQHLPGAAQVLLHMDRRWQQDLLGKALSPKLLSLWSCGQPQHRHWSQNRQQVTHFMRHKMHPNQKKFRFFAVEEWKAINHDWEQEALQIPGAEHVQLNPPVNPGN